MKFLATIQARMGSSRLPGKVLKQAGGKPLLLHQVERLRRSRLIDKVIVATSTNGGDDVIENFCDENDISVFRGPEDDVLGRVARCLSSYRGWGHVELVGDSPFVDPQMVDEFVGYFLKNLDAVDYVSNGIKITYPNGSEINVYRVETLLECDSRVKPDDPMREHVDIHIYKSGMYRCVNLVAPEGLNRPDLYIEIDTDKDYHVLMSIADYFHAAGHRYFSLADIIKFLDDNPQIAAINRNETRKYWEIKGKDR